MQSSLKSDLPRSAKTKEAKQQIWQLVDLFMEKFDTDQDGKIDKGECKSLLQGLYVGLGKEYDSSVLAKYYND